MKTGFCRFLGSDDHENFFTPVQRHQIVSHILSNAIYGKRKKAEIGIERLLDEEVFKAAFPLHDVSPKLGESRLYVGVVQFISSSWFLRTFILVILVSVLRL